MKCLFEVTNGYVGSIPVCVYVWAEGEARALELAEQSFRANGQGYPASYYKRSRLKAKRLFCEDASEFATLPSDEGWEMATNE